MLDPLRLAAAALEFGIVRYGRGQSWTAASIALVVVGAVCAGGAGGFAIAALTIYLIPILGPAGATLVVACALLTLAAMALALSHYLPRAQGSSNGHRAPQADIAALAAGAEDFIRENKGLALSAAVVAGLLASDDRARSTGDSPRRSPN